jgi:hypothetical protein
MSNQWKARPAAGDRQQSGTGATASLAIGALCNAPFDPFLSARGILTLCPIKLVLVCYFDCSFSDWINPIQLIKGDYLISRELIMASNWVKSGVKLFPACGLRALTTFAT